MPRAILYYKIKRKKLCFAEIKSYFLQFDISTFPQLYNVKNPNSNYCNEKMTSLK